MASLIMPSTVSSELWFGLDTKRFPAKRGLPVVACSLYEKHDQHLQKHLSPIFVGGGAKPIQDIFQISLFISTTGCNWTVAYCCLLLPVVVLEELSLNCLIPWMPGEGLSSYIDLLWATYPSEQKRNSIWARKKGTHLSRISEIWNPNLV